MRIELKPEAIREMLPPGSRVLCAVSGGADSMCLLHLLYTQREKLNIQVFAAHYEHGLRGEESLRDARFVRDWCQTQGVAFHMESGDVRAHAKEKGLGIEAAAREARYAFLEKTAQELNCLRIATAHNADDNAETVLFNLARGSGTAGLGGIPPIRGKIVRPLLGVTRREIEEYLKENGVPHVEDSSNATDRYSRNLIRHKVLPVLRTLNGDCAAAIGRATGLLRQDEDFLSSLARKFIEENYDGDSIPALGFNALHRAVSSRVVRQLCSKALDQDHVDAVLRLAQSKGLAYADVAGQRVRYEQGRIYFVSDEPVCIAPKQIKLGQSVSIDEAGLKLKADERIFAGEINDLFKNYYFKYDNIYGNIFCTGRRAGDGIRPAGRNCRKSLKSLFLEAKMTQHQRDTIPVLRDDAGVLAVLGLAVDERCMPEKGDKVLHIEIENT